MKKLVYHYADIALYILNIVFMVVVLVTMVDLKNHVIDVEKTLNTANEVQEIEVIIEEPKEPKEESINEIEVELPTFYTDDDAIALAKMLYGEARGVGELETAAGAVSGKCQQAAVIWTVLNRYDAGFADSIKSVVVAPHQYYGYLESNPVDDELLDLVYDVLDRWNNERNGETNVGRVLPSDYMWFHGDGQHNHFRNKYRGGSLWDWTLEDVYG